MDARLGGLETLQEIHDVKPTAEIVVAASRFDADLMNRALDIGPLTVLRRPVAKEDVQRLADAHRQASGQDRRTATEARSTESLDRMVASQQDAPTDRSRDAEIRGTKSTSRLGDMQYTI
jgi:DNA-binding NarL/FixJ family response regulator